MKINLRNDMGYYRSDMKGYDRLLISTVETLKDSRFTVNNELLLARPLSTESSLSLDHEGTVNSGGINITGPILLASHENIVIKLNNQWRCEKYPLTQISTLFSFIDYQTSSHNSSMIKTSQHEENIPTGSDNEHYIISWLDDGSERLMDILIRGILHPEKKKMISIFRFVRNMESYWISYFLLSQVFNNDSDTDATKLYNACKVYGVSESYFRKLCHNAFTCGPKKQLRIWRAANSALQLIEKDKSIATIAGNNGYSSSSHFSSEIKSIFGITPREFKKLEGLLHE